MSTVRVRVPASSANLGPGFDVLAAALNLHLTLTVSTADGFSISTTGEPTRENADNLVVRGFERLHSIDSTRFDAHLEIPPTRGLGSSAAAYVAGLVAANEYGRLGLSHLDLYDLAVELEGHPDNVAAALYGGVVVCSRAATHAYPTPVRVAAPTCVAPVVLIPRDPVKTSAARKVIPQAIPITEVVGNLGAIARLALGLERSDPDLIATGLSDRIHQRRRSDLFPRSFDLLDRAREFGAIGATISGAGPGVVFWCLPDDADTVAATLRSTCSDWSTVSTLSFCDSGAEILEPGP